MDHLVKSGRFAPGVWHAARYHGEPGRWRHYVEESESKELITRAAERGVLSPTSTRALQRYEIVSQIEEALEESYGIESAGEVLLVTMMPDDSRSMIIGRKYEGVIAGHNDLLRAFRESPARYRTLLQTRYLNGDLLNPFQPLDECTLMTSANYDLEHGTPLYEQTIVTLGTVIAKAEELLEQGAARVRTATLLMTDAETTGSEALDVEVASVVADMRKIGDHIVAGMGFPTTRIETFREIFRAMGIDERFIFAAHNRDEILRAFRMFGSKALELTDGTDDQETGI
jgi:hypothetical protein